MRRVFRWFHFAFDGQVAGRQNVQILSVVHKCDGTLAEARTPPQALPSHTLSTTFTDRNQAICNPKPPQARMQSAHAPRRGCVRAAPRPSIASWLRFNCLQQQPPTALKVLLHHMVTSRQHKTSTKRHCSSLFPCSLHGDNKCHQGKLLVSIFLPLLQATYAQAVT